ncbi:MAG: T9SS type A sorting domain-containing protein [Flavobacteriales bacterium]|nr:T9SS type A sorting domain-containing protein [Flavobacteriales bacterium]
MKLKLKYLSLPQIGLVVGILFSQGLVGQQLEPVVFGSAGSSNVVNSFTIGEVISETFSTTTLILSQGFHQGDFASVSVQEQPNHSSIYLFPNPVRFDLTIAMPEIQQAQLKLFDATGKLIREFQAQHGDRIDMSAFARGLYIVHVLPSDGTTSQRFSIIRS